jgi:AcrR family transcriptional regulator
MATRTRLDHDERREQILAAACRLYAQRHYADVSTTDIASAAGVTRGLVHHYFGRKRDLYVEVVTSMLRAPDLGPPRKPGQSLESALSDAVDRWLEMVHRSRETWLATLGAQGFGRDEEIESVLERARERIADRLISMLRPDAAVADSAELRAVVRAYAGFAEAGSLEWLRGRITREQIHDLLLHGLLNLVRDVLPRLERGRAALAVAQTPARAP